MDARRILVVEDEHLMAGLLVAVLRSCGFDSAVAHTAGEAREVIDEFDPDAVLLDIVLGDGPTGIDLARVLHQQSPGVALVFLTKHPDLQAAGINPADLPPGAGFLRKDLVSDEAALIEAIESVLADRPEAARHDRIPAGHPLTALRPTQVEVLRLAAQGLSNSAIARARHTSQRAVEIQLQRAAAALGVVPSRDLNVRVEVVRRYIEAVGLPPRS